MYLTIEIYISSFLEPLPDLEWFSQTAGKLGGFWMHRKIQQSRKPVLVCSPHFPYSLFICKTSFYPDNLRPERLFISLVASARLFSSVYKTTKKREAVEEQGIECVFPSQAQHGGPTLSFLAATSSASAAPSKGSHGNYIASKVDFVSKMR